MRIDESGAVQSVWVQHWGNVGQADYGYIPFGGDVAAEGRFGDAIIPTALEGGWWYGTPRYSPFSGPRYPPPWRSADRTVLREPSLRTTRSSPTLSNPCPRFARVSGLDLDSDEEFGAEATRLAVRASSEFRAADAIRKAGVVLDPRARAGLPAGRVPLAHQRAKPL
jgi:hypothetical protein